MALLDFMKEGFNSLQSQPQMYDPHANAKRLMGGPVQEQQGGGTGFNFFGGNNASQNAQEPLPRMDVTGTVGGPSMTPYQGQEVGPSHLGVTNIDKTNNYSPDLPGGGTYNQYQGIYDENPGARVEGYYNPIATYTGLEMPNSMQSDGSVAKVGIDDLYNQPAPYTPDSNMIWSVELQRYVPVTADGGTQQNIPYNKPTNTTGYNTNLLGTGNELVGPTQVNGGGATVADNEAEVAAAKLKKQREASNAEVDAARLYPEYIDRSGMSTTNTAPKETSWLDSLMWGDDSNGAALMEYFRNGGDRDPVVNLDQSYNTNEFNANDGASGNSGEQGVWDTIVNFGRGIGTDEGGEVDSIDQTLVNTAPAERKDYLQLRKNTEIAIQIDALDVPDARKIELYNQKGIPVPDKYGMKGLISKK